MAGGLTKGKSHAKGGIKMKVKSTGQNIEVEGGEGIINKHTMSSKDKHTFEGKEMTACEIASDLNQKTGNGVSFDCDETDNTDMTPTDQSTGFAKGGKPKRKYKKKKMAKSKKKTGAYAKLVSKIMKRDGVTYREAQKKAKDEYVSGATSQKKKPKKTYKGRVDNLKSKSATKISYSGRPKMAKGGEISLNKKLKSYIDTLGKEDLISMRNELGREIDKGILDESKYKDELAYLNNRIGKDMYAKGGITKGQTLSENFNMKDEVQNVEFWKNDVIVKDKQGKVKRIDLDKGERISVNAKGGKTKKFSDYLQSDSGEIYLEWYESSIKDSRGFYDDGTLQFKEFKTIEDAEKFYKNNLDLNYKKSYAKGGEIIRLQRSGNQDSFDLTRRSADQSVEIIKQTANDFAALKGLNEKQVAIMNSEFNSLIENGSEDYGGDENLYVEDAKDLFNKHIGLYGKDHLATFYVKDYYAKGGELMDSDTQFDYAKGGDVSGKPVVESLDKIVTHYNGDEFDLDNYPPESSAEWMSDAMELTLEEAKQFSKELDFGLEYSEDVEDAENLQDLQYAILEDTQEKANHDNTYNASWWGGVVDFFVLERKEEDGYGEALVILRNHKGGDPRGNYYGYEAFKLNNFIEDFPPYYARLTYQIKTNQGNITLDTDDMEGYSLLVVEDETGTFKVDDYVTLDDVEEKLDMNNESLYAKGGQTKKFNNGGNIMDKKEELAASLSSQLKDIDFQYLDWNEINNFDELEEEIDNNGFFQQEVIYYGTAMDYLREQDPSLREALELAGDMGFDAGRLNSEILASILKSERVRESFYELRTEVDDFFDELED